MGSAQGGPSPHKAVPGGRACPLDSLGHQESLVGWTCHGCLRGAAFLFRALVGLGLCLEKFLDLPPSPQDHSGLTERLYKAVVGGGGGAGSWQQGWGVSGRSAWWGEPLVSLERAFVKELHMRVGSWSPSVLGVSPGLSYLNGGLAVVIQAAGAR